MEFDPDNVNTDAEMCQHLYAANCSVCSKIAGRLQELQTDVVSVSRADVINAIPLDLIVYLEREAKESNAAWSSQIWQWALDLKKLRKGEL